MIMTEHGYERAIVISMMKTMIAVGKMIMHYYHLIDEKDDGDDAVIAAQVLCIDLKMSVHDSIVTTQQDPAQ
jgi:hypothetical protein